MGVWEQVCAPLRAASPCVCVPTDHLYMLILFVDPVAAILSTVLFHRGLIFGEGQVSPQNLIWEWNLGALLSS